MPSHDDSCVSFDDPDPSLANSAPTTASSDVAPTDLTVLSLQLRISQLEAHLQSLTTTHPPLPPPNHCVPTLSTAVGPAPEESPTWRAISKKLAQNMIPTPFSGEGTANPVAFMNQLRTLLRLEHLPLKNFKTILPSVLTGRARSWFYTIEAEILTSEDFFTFFRYEFASTPYVRSLNAEITRQKQGREESAVAFLDRLARLCACLPNPPSDMEIIEKIIMGLNDDFALHLGCKEYRSLGGLRADCHRMDFLRANARRPDARSRELTHPRVPTQTRYPDNGNRPFTQGTQYFFPSGARPLTCFNCGDPSHFRRQCPHPLSNQGNEHPAGTSPRQ